MTPEHWREIERIFDQVIDLPRGEQVAVLENVDPELRLSVEKLLASEPEAAAVVKDAVAEGEALLGAVEFPDSAIEQRLGPYQLVRRLAQGGQGSVFEAARVDGSFHQKVAIKIIKWEIDSEPARARFRQERQILATLDHPYIARLLDGGETQAGAPYLVMEFVDGVPLDAAIKNSPLRSKLELFLKIADAVTFAHANLIVHRDLKPANILVTADEKPKILDFGIARLIDDSPVTMTALRAFTPSYASPEQVLGDPITTASDVYSLGVVLYEVLTGRRPYEVQTTSPVEMHRAVCLTPPSAAHLGDDLDNILLMALRKEPARRYASVRDFSDDVRRFLEFRPVKARKDSLAYRTSRFVRRNRTGVTASLVLAGALTTAFVLTLRAERLAQTRFEDVRQLATTFLVDFDRDIRQLPGSTPARERLVSTALQQFEKLSKNSTQDPILTSELVHAYASVGDVLGMPGLPSLGHADRAEQSYRKSCELADRLLKLDSSASSSGRTRSTFSYSRLGYLIYRQGRSSEARTLMLKAVDLIGPKIAAAGATADDFRAAANAYAYLAQLENHSSHARLSESYSAKALELMRKYQSQTPGLRARSNLARAISIGSQAAAPFDLARALNLRKEGIAIGRQLMRENPNDVEVRRELAVDLEFESNLEDQPDGPSLGLVNEALLSIKESIEIQRALSKQDPSNASAKRDFAMAILRLALIDLESRPALAEKRLAEAIEVMTSAPVSFKGRNREIGILFTALAQAHQAQNRAAQANAALDHAESLFKTESSGDIFLEEDWRIFWGAEGSILLHQGQASQAIAEFLKQWNALAPNEKDAIENINVAFQLAKSARDLAAAYRAAGNIEGSSIWSGRKTRIWAAWQGKYPMTDSRLEFSNHSLF